MIAQISIDAEQVLLNSAAGTTCKSWPSSARLLERTLGRRAMVDLLITFAPGTAVSLFDLVDMAEDLAPIRSTGDFVLKKGLKPLHSQLGAREFRGYLCRGVTVSTWPTSLRRPIRSVCFSRDSTNRDVNAS